MEEEDGGKEEEYKVEERGGRVAVVGGGELRDSDFHLVLLGFAWVERMADFRARQMARAAVVS